MSLGEVGSTRYAYKQSMSIDVDKSIRRCRSDDNMSWEPLALSRSCHEAKNAYFEVPQPFPRFQGTKLWRQEVVQTDLGPLNVEILRTGERADHYVIPISEAAAHNFGVVNAAVLWRFSHSHSRCHCCAQRAVVATSPHTLRLLY